MLYITQTITEAGSKKITSLKKYADPLQHFIFGCVEKKNHQRKKVQGYYHVFKKKVSLDFLLGKHMCYLAILYVMKHGRNYIPRDFRSGWVATIFGETFGVTRMLKIFFLHQRNSSSFFLQTIIVLHDRFFLLKPYELVICVSCKFKKKD